MVALVWAKPNGEFDSDLKALFYDPALDVWGNKTQLTSDQELEANIAAAIYGDKLIAIYNRTIPPPRTDNSDSKGFEDLTSIPPPGTTDLYMLTHTVGGDLAIKPHA